MPDYTYVLYRPLVTRLLPHVHARALTVKAVGLQGKSSTGRRLFEWLAAARPSPRLTVKALGMHFPAPAGIGAHVDLTGEGLRMWHYLGAGFTIVGPVSSDAGHETRLLHDVCGVLTGERDAANIRDVVPKLRDPMARGPVLVAVTGHDISSVIKDVAPHADGVIVPMPPSDRLHTLSVWAEQAGVPVIVELAADYPPEEAIRCTREAIAAGCAGVILTGSETRLLPAGRESGPFLLSHSCTLTRELRARFGRSLTIIGGPGVMTPSDAREALRSGADLIALYEGLIYAGPGLPRRINTSLMTRRSKPQSHSTAPVRPAAITGILLVAALLVATGVGGLTDALLTPRLTAELRAAHISPDGPLALFVLHNRVNLAGAMMCLGMLWGWLAWRYLRAGYAWAWWALALSGSTAAAGFLAGHLATLPQRTDTTIVILVAAAVYATSLVVSGRASRIPGALFTPGATAWLWSPAGRGRALLALAAIGLISGGAMITAVGHTRVFVPQDLQYLGDVDLIAETVAFVAADRLAFGTALLASGVAALPMVWCGLRPGSRALLTVLACAIMTALVPAVGIHPVIGYNDIGHLAPFIAIGVYCLAGTALLWRPMVTGMVDEFPDLWFKPVAGLH
ncbi:hypothetical protein ONR57_00025 [Hoyosella sp. YIM 151337]|uniref:hypothetical protein n=1 Tax=Hoyosella sp. YIM 151337 TaxID=2992742 RepID=UPI002235B461|nr:hypothetical protein [Hoyosella sp. YIM 151337]MCW4351689.1 hypothetical protein [Hoyosella sp. YIM 151337]